MTMEEATTSKRGVSRLVAASVVLLVVALVALPHVNYKQKPQPLWATTTTQTTESSLLRDSVLKTSKDHPTNKNNNDNNNNNINNNNNNNNKQPLTALRKLDADTTDPFVLNVHVVPHTHDDVGWLKTVEEYYYGLNTTIQDACVQDILDTTVIALLESPSRTFTYVEQKFFSMWWKDQPDAIRDSVRWLIANQQLSFVNGGWCMHDEAATHYMGMIDQTTLGHSFLKEELGVIPTVGWQLDPFGHSATQASLLTAKVGFDALYFGRIDYQDLQLRHTTQECEGLWSSSTSFATNDTAVFFGLTGSFSGNYEAPRGFCFDKRCFHDWEHDPLLTNMTRAQVLERVNWLVQELKTQSDRTKGNHIMLTFGSDFNYQRAGVYFANIDLLMESLQRFQEWGLINATSALAPRFQRINIFYSSPEYYTKMKHQQTTVASRDRHNVDDTITTTTDNIVEATVRRTRETTETDIQWAIKKDDFFPYSDCEHCFWTGYFTSRSSFKRLERVASSFLLAARQIESYPEKKLLFLHETSNKYSNNDEEDCLGWESNCDKPLFDLEDALGVAQHHDAVSGTAKQHVSNDYSKRIQAGINKASLYVANKLKRLLAVTQEGVEVLDNLTFCQLINETICDISQEATKSDDTELYVVVYNPLGSNKSSIVRLPVAVSGSFDVTRLDNEEPLSSVTTRTVPNHFVGNHHASSSPARFVLNFETGPLSPVGATVFRVKRSSSGEAFDPTMDSLSTKREDSESDRVVVANDEISVQFDRDSGAMHSITANGVTLVVNQNWGYYTSYDSKFDKPNDIDNNNASRKSQNSGAYIFRPAMPDQEMHTIDYLQDGFKFENTSIGIEVHVSFEEPWIKQVTRVMKGLPYVEVEYSIGPIPIGDGRGKEIITRFITPIKSNATFYTDSNGREFLKRRRDYRPSWPLEVFEPVAGNYYPVNAAVYVEDETSSFSVLVDRTQGGSSILDGSIELMAQRRTLADDDRGVAEPMNETDGGVTPYPPFGHAQRWGNGIVIRGTYRIVVGQGNSGASMARSGMDSAFASPLTFVASTKASPKAPPALHTSLSALQDALPPNVMLISFKKLKASEFLIRLGHQYGLNEDKELSKPVQVDLSRLFSAFKVTSVVEMTLSGNRAYNDWVKTRLDWTGSGPIPKSQVDSSNTVVILSAMEVRTFVLKMEEL